MKITCRINTNKCDKSVTWGIFTKPLSHSHNYKNIYKIDILPDDYDNLSNPLWICREFTDFHLDTLSRCYIQPIQSFRNDDLIIFYINLYSAQGFIDLKYAKFILTTESIPPIQLPNNKTEIDYLDPRICEMELMKNRWKDITYFPNNDLIFDKIVKIFNNCFNIEKIIYDDVGYVIFKIFLKAERAGLIPTTDELGITIRVKDENEIIKNEVKKNNLIYEKRNILELRKNDTLIFYLSHSK